MYTLGATLRATHLKKNDICICNFAIHKWHLGSPNW